jgi:hypothetical protein
MLWIALTLALLGGALGVACLLGLIAPGWELMTKADTLVVGRLGTLSILLFCAAAVIAVAAI